ncbi:TIGR03620 family F420-dependent LLM class oxidoreductase [Streptomyces sp. NPDC048290]|uniref:TIGR03620 family F420-dependent LLM class oxidoreductase n=1 Tax=Streptomyces sp. NPDC048290 TaxID=3155811 RepID=UPI00344274C5
MSETPLKQRLGRYGVWSGSFRAEDAGGQAGLDESAAELEELGFGTLWVGGNTSVAVAAPLIRATSRLTVGTSVQNIWLEGPTETAAAFAALDATHPGRLLLGLGVGHAQMEKRYHRPYSALVDYLDALDTDGFPAGRRLLAALGPRTLRLAGQRAAGAIPYLVTPEHTAYARDILGPGPLLAPEVGVVLSADPAEARALARARLDMYLSLPNYTGNFLRHGFTEDDLTDGGSDRLVDALFAWGDESRVRARLDAFHQAGADHLALQVIDADEQGTGLPRRAWRDLAALLG